MIKENIIAALELKHKSLYNWLENQPESKWIEGPDGKWTTGQHFLHLINSLQLLNNALSYPRFILKYKFGICNRATRDYDTVADNYEKKLAKNKERAKAFNKKLKTPTLAEKDRLITKFKIQQKKLQYKTQKISDKNLDTLLIPHPLMGKMTIREIIMWTAHHTEHHTTMLQENY